MEELARQGAEKEALDKAVQEMKNAYAEAPARETHCRCSSPQL